MILPRRSSPAWSSIGLARRCCLQLTFFSQVELFHVSPDVLPALVVSLGLLGGSLTGAVCGFSIGFLLDCLLIQPLGGGSLVLLAVGYSPAIFRERFEIHSASGAAAAAAWC